MSGGRINDPAGRKAQIMTAALTLFAQKGFYQTGMNDIVAASGVSKGGVYWHFASKEQIIMAILAEVFEQDTAALLAIGDGEGTAVEKLRAILHHMAQTVLTQRPLLPILYEFYTLAPRHPAVGEAMVGYFEQYQALLAAVVEHGVGAGELATAEPTAVAQALIAQFEGQLLLAHLRGDWAGFVGQVGAAGDWLLAGLRP